MARARRKQNVTHDERSNNLKRPLNIVKQNVCSQCMYRPCSDFVDLVWLSTIPAKQTQHVLLLRRVLHKEAFPQGNEQGPELPLLHLWVATRNLRRIGISLLRISLLRGHHIRLLIIWFGGII